VPKPRPMTVSSASIATSPKRPATKPSATVPDSARSCPYRKLDPGWHDAADRIIRPHGRLSNNSDGPFPLRGPDANKARGGERRPSAPTERFTALGGEEAAAHPSRSAHIRLAVSAVPVHPGCGDGDPSRRQPSAAPRRLPTLLALEIPASRRPPLARSPSIQHIGSMNSCPGTGGQAQQLAFRRRDLGGHLCRRHHRPYRQDAW
jgi:hypothetical protein